MNTRICSVIASVTLLTLSSGCGGTRNFLFGRGARCGMCRPSAATAPAYTTAPYAQPNRMLSLSHMPRFPMHLQSQSRLTNLDADCLAGNLGTNNRLHQRRPRDADARTHAATSIQEGVEPVPEDAELATTIPVLVESVWSRVPAAVAADPIVAPVRVAMAAASRWSRILT